MNLKQYRKLKGWNQQYVADKVGVVMSMISMIEHGKRRPSPQLALKIEDLTGGAVPFRQQLIRDDLVNPN